MPVIGATVYTSSSGYDIDYWKRYRSVNGGAYAECTAEIYDYLCPSVKVDDQQVYSFNAPVTIGDDLSVGDTVQYQWRPAHFDSGYGSEYYITSEEYVITESSGVAPFCVSSSMNSLAMA